MSQIGAYLSHSKLRWIFVLGLGLYGVTPWINPGFVALDDYTSVTEFFVPAQNQTVAKIINNSEIRSPLPRLALFALSSTLLAGGISDPFVQYKLVLTFIGIFSFLAFGYGAYSLFGAEGPRSRWALFLISGFFLCPFFYSRAMIESLSAPFLLLSATMAVRYHRQGHLSALLWSVLFLAIASVMRFQTGVCVLGLFFLIRRKSRDWAAFLGTGLFLFLLTGWVDYWMRGRFHESLFSYVDYNIHHSSSYGTTPFYTYLLLWIALLLPPTFFSRFRGFPLREYREQLKPLLWFIFIFIVSHSAIPHKEERFMVPVLPLVLMAIVPPAEFLFRTQKWRQYYFLILNGFLLFVTITSTPQRNALELVRYLNRHPQITRLYDFEGSVVPYLSAFLNRPVDHVYLPENEMERWRPSNCQSATAVRWDWVGRLPDPGFPLEPLGIFEPAWPEALFVRLNPLRNSRRGPITLLRAAGCQR